MMYNLKLFGKISDAHDSFKTGITITTENIGLILGPQLLFFS